MFPYKKSYVSIRQYSIIYHAFITYYNGIMYCFVTKPTESQFSQTGQKTSFVYWPAQCLHLPGQHAYVETPGAPNTRFCRNQAPHGSNLTSNQPLHHHQSGYIFTTLRWLDQHEHRWRIRKPALCTRPLGVCVCLASMPMLRHREHQIPGFAEIKHLTAPT